MQGVEANPNLYVHNVPKDSNEEELRHLFGQFGSVERVRLKVNQKVGPHAVYAFVTFSSTADAQRALNKLQGSDVRGRALRIEFQRTSTTTGSHSGGGYYGSSTWESAESAQASPNEPRTPLSSTQSTTAHNTPYLELFRRENTNPDNSMWTATTWRGDSATENLMPPFKRGRFHSPSSRRPRSPVRSANVLGPDGTSSAAGVSPQAASTTEIFNVLAQLKQLVSQSHPHAVSLVDSLSEILRPEVVAVKPNVLHPVMGGASEKWPFSELSPALKALARDGTLTLNQETNRYLVRLSPLLAPLKPAMFNRRSGSATTTTQPERRMAETASPPYVAPSAVQPATLKPVVSNPEPQPTATQPPTATQQPVATQQQQQQPPTATQQPVAQQLATAGPGGTPISFDEAAWITQLNTLPLTHARKEVWQGTLARNDKKKMPVSMKRLAGYIEQFLPSSMSTLNISHRSAVEEMWKKKIGAIGILEAENSESAKAFQEYINYFKDKNRAGVARLERSEYQMVYLLPVGLAYLGETITSNLPTSGDYLLAIVGRPPTAKLDYTPPDPKPMLVVEDDCSSKPNEQAETNGPTATNDASANNEESVAGVQE